MVDVFESYANHTFDNNEHTELINTMWGDAEFPWQEMEHMSDYVRAMYGPRMSTEFEVFLDKFDMAMTCASVCSYDSDTRLDDLSGGSDIDDS
jgi:hypothetical protein